MPDTRAESWPHPVAHAYREFAVAAEPRERLDQASRFLECTIVFLGVVAAEWCAAHRTDASAFRAWERSLPDKGPSLGGCVAVLRESGLVEKAWVAPLSAFVTFRNDLAHGGRPRRRSDLIARSAEASRLAESVAEHPGLISELDLHQVQRSRVLDDGSFEIELREMTGTSSRFPLVRGRSPKALKEGAILCLRRREPMTETRDLSDAIDLSGSIRYGICECGEEELFYLTKRKATLERYKSFENGHAYERPTGPSIPPQAAPAPAATATFRHQAPTAKVAGRPPQGKSWRQHALAGRPGRRLLAWVVDVAAASACAAIACLLATWAGLPLWAVVLAGLVPWLTCRSVPRSLGKSVTDLVLLQVDTGRAPGIGRRVVRSVLVLLQEITVLPIWVSVYWIGRDPARQGLHDRAVRTVVVRGSELKRLHAARESTATKEQRSRRTGPA